MNSMRISGIASGMDTETMIRDLMKAERVKADRYGQSKQIAKWRQEQYNDINKDMANFVLDVTKEFGVKRSISGSMISDTSSLSWVKGASSSDESVFTAKATADAATGTHSIKVEQLAKGVNVASKAEVKTTSDVKATSATTLEELGVTTTGDLNLKFEIAGSKFVDVKYTKDTTIKELVDKINKATVSATDSTPLGLQASFDDATGRLFLATKETGEKAQIKIISDGQNLFTGDKTKNKFKLLKDDGAGNDIAILKENPADNEVLHGTDAKIEFDGAKDLFYSSNNFTINGIDIDLNKAEPGTAHTIKVDTDVDAIYDKIKFFVDKYNDLVDKLNGKTSEKRYRDFKPLTKEERESMKEDEVKLWEEKAKSGLLKDDELISRPLQTMRSGLYETVYDKYDTTKTKEENKPNRLSGFDQLFDIGITTGGWKDKGKLVISDDPDKGLKAAIEKDVDGVLNLLFKASEVTKSDSSLTKEERTQKRNESGIINRLFDDVVTGMKNIVKKSGTGENAEIYRDVKSNILIDFVTNGGAGKGSISLLDEDVLGIEKMITREERRLASVENKYWSKFTAMEKALSKMNSQSDWLAGQLGGM